MKITLDFLKNNKDWYVVTISPIDARRGRIVGTFLDKHLPTSKYNLETIDGVYNITRKIK